MMTTILGIDVAKDSLAVSLLNEGEAILNAEFDNNKKGFNKLNRWLGNHDAPVVHACMEATGRYWEQVALFLFEKGHTVSVVNPLQIKKYAQSQLRRNKTDKMDAQIIADFCKTQETTIWTPPEPCWTELQVLVRHLEDLEADRQRQRNRLHALQHSAQPSSIVQTNLQQQIQFLSEQIEQIKRLIQDHIDRYPDLQEKRALLSSIKGIGPLTAAKLLGEYGDMSQFSDVRQVVAFAGLNPQHKESGSSVRGQTNISKIGRSSIRAALYMPAVNAKRFNPRMIAFADRLAERGLCNMEIIVAIMRKLLHFAYGVLKSGQPYYANLGLKTP
jgi:transposase